MLDLAHPLETLPHKIADRYAVIGLLGRGGMADVFRVRDELTGRELALKQLRPQPSGRKALAVAHFEREYYTLAQLAHPSVIQVHEYGVDEHGAHYTMELLEGSDLLALGRRPWRQACSVLRDIASALAVLHSRCWLHRDLSPRNVFETHEGVAKLIDFGAMMPMGVPKSLVGTPPVVPPEAVQQQALDAQSDLYSLGALAYFMLTGRHAFPARSFDELRDLWRTVLRPPDRIVPQIPAALSQLVLELLNLDRFARPASAAAVIERIDGLLGRASEASQERPEAGRAYLTTPKLAGRDQELAQVRERMVHSLRGRGAVLLIEGEAGSGRSRFLDACVLEARLLGATVLRADASDGARGDYGVVAALGEQLVQFAPKLAADVARLRRSLLARIIPSLASAPEQDGQDGGTSERRHVQTALRDWFRAIARSRRIVIAVDDLERIDEPSLAVLAALAHKSERRKLVLVASIAADTRPSSGLELLRDAATRIVLPLLSEAQSEALLESLFGHAANTAVLAHRIHELARGNPRQVMALAEHLVARGLARYAAGSWTLDDRLDAADLPPSLEAALALRIAGLDAGALALAEALALTDPRSLSLSEYRALYDQDDHAAMFKGLDQLVEAGILAPEGERYRFTHAGWRQSLLEHVDGDRARSLHERLARVLQGSGDSMRAAHHLMESGQEREATALVLAKRGDAGFSSSDRALALLQRVALAADTLEVPAKSRLELRLSLLETAAALGRLDVFKRFAEDTLSELEVASGIRAFQALDPELPPEERLQRALALAQAQHDALPVHDRPFEPPQALALLLRLAFAFAAMAGSALEPGLVERLPALGPFGALSPLASFAQLTVDASKDHLAGRYLRARASYERLLGKLEALGPNTTDAYRRARLTTRYALGIFEATNGMSSALERVAALEHEPGYRVNAWRVRMVYYASLGDLEEARRCERRAQLLLLQDGARPSPATDLLAEASARFLSDDLDGLKQMFDRLQEAAERFPARGALRTLAHVHYLRIKGSPAAALEQLSTVLASTSPEKGVRFAWTGATHLMLLNALGRHAEAVSTGRHYLTASLERGLELGDCALMVRPLAEALALSGNAEEAIELAEALIARFEGAGDSGLGLGSCYETRARIALATRDAEAFDRWTERCRSEYQRAHNPALRAKLARLLREGQLAHVAGPLTSTEPAREEEDASERVGEDGTVLSRMAECVDARERARCALTLLMEETGAGEGHLYGWLSGRLTHLVSVPELAPPLGLDEMIQRCIEAELGACDTTSPGGNDRPAPIEETPAPESHPLQPALLCAQRDGEPLVAAAAALGGQADPALKPSAKLLSTLAQSLLEHDDVDALARFV